MNVKLSNKIINEIEKYCEVNCAVTDKTGLIQAATKNFEQNSPQIDTKSPSATPLKCEKKVFGFLFVEDKEETPKEIISVLKSMAEVIIEQDQLTQTLTSDEKRLDQTTYDFLYTDTVSDQEYLYTLRSFGVDTKTNRTALLLEIVDPNYLMLEQSQVIQGEKENIVARVKRSLESLLSLFYTKHTDNIIFYLGGKNFLILKDMGADPKEYQAEFKKTLNNLHFNIESELRTKITIGVGDFKEGMQGIKESFTEARTALKFGEQTWGQDKIFHYDNFGVVAPLFSGANQDNIYYSKGIVENLSKHKGMLETLKVYLESDLSLSKTSKILGIHRNTLVYRLGRIEELTTLDPKIFDDAFQLQIALILEAYHV